MAVSVPSVSGTACSDQVLPAPENSSFFRINGGPIVPPSAIAPDRVVSYSTFDNEVYTYTLRTTPQYLGQLLWSNTIGTPQIFSPTTGAARLFIAVEVEIPEGDPLLPYNLKWVPVSNVRSGIIINADTGRPMDYLGEYTCNPPWLCR